MNAKHDQAEDIKRNDLIRRLITNQRDEHTPHAFRAGHAGMQDFNILVPILRSRPAKEIRSWLGLIDEVADSHQYCTYCFGKITAYRILMTRGIEPLAIEHTNYMEQYARLLAEQRDDEERDFIKEVIDSMYHGKEHPHRKLYAFHWHEMVETIRCEGRHQLGKDAPFLIESKTLRAALDD